MDSRHSFLASLAFFAAAAAAVGSPALACKRSAPAPSNICLYWPSRQIAFAIRADPVIDIAAVNRSFATWNDVPCTDLVFLDGGVTSETRVGFRVGDRTVPAPAMPENVIMARSRLCTDPGVVPENDPCWETGGCQNKFDCWEAWADTIAVTTTTWKTRCGEILDTDIELNSARKRFTVADGPTCSSASETSCVSTDLQNTLTHELGHALGFDHSDDAEATMFSTQPLGETKKRDLTIDDTTCLCEVYPTGKPPKTCATCPAEETSSGCCNRGSGWSSSLAMIVVGYIFLGRPKKRADRFRGQPRRR